MSSEEEDLVLMCADMWRKYQEKEKNENIGFFGSSLRFHWEKGLQILFYRPSCFPASLSHYKNS